MNRACCALWSKGLRARARRARRALAIVGTLVCGVGSALAQGTPEPSFVLSFDPYGVPNQRLTTDAEFCGNGELSGSPLGCSLPVGLSGTVERHRRSAGSRASRHHVDLDGFLRLRSRRDFSGWWVGFRTGLTYADRYGIRPSLGTEAGLSRQIGRRVYAGASVGVKKVFFLDDASDLRYNPALRLAAGIVF